MAVMDADSERLETYLDGELPAAESRVLEGQLERDAVLAAELEALREARRVRLGLWRGLEADATDVQRVQDRLERALRREHAWRRRALGLRWFAAAAASVLIGVGLGWSGRAAMNDTRSAAGSHRTVAVQSPGDGGTRVALTDERGQVLAVQQFDSLETARQFSRDLRQWQQRQEQVRQSNVILVGDRF